MLILFYYGRLGGATAQPNTLAWMAITITFVY